MKALDKLLNGLDYQLILGNIDVSVSDIHFNSNNVVPLSMFVANSGGHHDGHDFISDAISAGAVVIVCERIPQKTLEGVTYVKVVNSSFALGILSCNFFKHPSKRIKLIGVTGTNGKTSIVYHLFSIFRALGLRVGLISTIEQKINDTSYPTTHTTPDTLEINKLLSLMVNEGCEFCFMEVSSHGILQNRIAGLSFDLAVFTNLTRDHLDYHNSFSNYLNTKKSFFDTMHSTAKSIINGDDKYGSLMSADTKSIKIFYSIKKPGHYQARIIEDSINGLTLEIEGEQITTPLIGLFNAYNLLAAYAVAKELGQNKNAVLKILTNLELVPGRFNTVKSKSGVIGIIDYAHTPDALKKIILSISSFCKTHNNLITVIGCGGDRDVGKRSIMGKIAVDYSSVAIFTSDNPRSENPQHILDDMCLELSDEQKNNVKQILNREDAIRFAVDISSKDSVILIAGKGHEKFQEIHGKKIIFDDLKVLQNFFKK